MFMAPPAVAFRDSDPNRGRRRQLGPRDVEKGKPEAGEETEGNPGEPRGLAGVREKLASPFPFLS